MRQFTRGCACPMCYLCSWHSKISGFPIPYIEKCLGSAQPLLRLQGIPPAPARIPMLRVGFFPCRTQKGQDKAVLFCPLFGSLGRQKGKRTVVVTVGSCQLSPVDVCCTSATALELSLPFPVLFPPPQTLKVTAGDKHRCRWVSELIWGNHHYILQCSSITWGLCKFSTSWGQVRGWMTPEGAEVLLQDAVEMPSVLV